jgi:outer membrane PBP1 activator LpoA protein
MVSLFRQTKRNHLTLLLTDNVDWNVFGRIISPGFHFGHIQPESIETMIPGRQQMIIGQ